MKTKNGVLMSNVMSHCTGCDDEVDCSNDGCSSCHDPVYFSLQIPQVINELHDLMTISPYLILSTTLLITPLSYQRQDDIIFTRRQGNNKTSIALD